MPKLKEISNFKSLLVTLFTPFALLMQYSVVLFHKAKECSNIIHNPKRELSGESIMLKTKTFNFKDIRKCYKQYENVTFNNYVMGVLSKSIHSWYAKNKVENPGNLIMSCPVGMKAMPKSIKEVNLNNHTSGVTIQFPVLGDLREALKETQERFSKFFKLHYLISAIYFQSIFRYIPRALGRALYN